MGRIATLLSFVRLVKNGARVTDVKVNPGGGPNITAEHFADAGDDSHPLTTDYVALNEDSGTGRESAIGYLDPLNTPKAEPGEKRIYGRDANTGAVVVEVWLQNDGTALVANENGSVTLRPDGGTVVTTPESTFDAAADGSITGDNGNGSFELQGGGDFLVNGVTIDSSGNVTIPTSLTLAGKEIAGHDHNITSGSSAPGPTGPNN